MTDERKYEEREIQEIFKRAASQEDLGSPGPSTGHGLTLAELQEIGRGVGLETSRIAEAAVALDSRREALPRRKQLGMPISVGRIVELQRAPTDREWELLVAELRRTFGAHGKVVSQGSLREWTNGNLHVCVEPTATGHRLRLGTRKGNAMEANVMGFVFLALGVVTLGAVLLKGGAADDLFLSGVFAAMGAGAFAFNALRLPRWAREREEQMESIADRARTLLGTESREEDSGQINDKPG
ncbi:MAG: hypothetical protein AMS21_09360 [Gemmatimonas sp. SG8_38_2]|nr:MAG: hypothetical protein AMS21_09360 [Gemmatimonas sp. SG8_38_2]